MPYQVVDTLYPQPGQQFLARGTNAPDVLAAHPEDVLFCLSTIHKSLAFEGVIL